MTNASSDPYWDRRIETMSRDELRFIQDHRLQWQIHRCWDGSEFYRARFKAAGLEPGDLRGVGDLARVPLLAMADLHGEIRTNPPLGRGVVAPPDWWREQETARTGQAMGLPSVWTEADIVNRVNVTARALWSIGIRPGDKHLVDLSAASRLTARTVAAADRKLGAQASVTVGATDGEPTFAAGSLGTEPGRDGPSDGRDPSLGRWVVTVSDQLSDDEQHAHTAVPTQSFCVWSRPELGPTVAAECETRAGLHVAEDHFLVELIDPATTRAVEDGQYGSLVVTHLTREGTPLVRFVTGIVATLDPTRCACGRTHV